MKMSALTRFFVFSNEISVKVGKRVAQRYFSSQLASSKLVETVDKEPQASQDENSSKRLCEYRFVYPEFLPNPAFEFRNKIREKIERQDMLKRRSVIEIPEFYVGSILAATTSDPYAPGKENKFVGICTRRTYNGLNATFTLRNAVDNQGVEILYQLYNPTLLSIEVLKLEKRLDESLEYLRDAPLEYSYVPFDMEPEFLVEGQPVPINTIKVKLHPPPWHQKWERMNMKGIVENWEGVFKKRLFKAKEFQTPWEKYDLMKEYRRSIPEEDQVEIWQDVDVHKKASPVKKQLWKRTLQKAKPKARPTN